MPGQSYAGSKSATKATYWGIGELMTSEEVAVLDENTAYLGVSTLCLMENAGKEVADFVSAKLGDKVEGKKIAVFAGMGNNGGDGSVAARHLAHMGAFVDFVLLGSPQEIHTAEASQNYKAIDKMVFSVRKHVVRDSSELDSIAAIAKESDVIIDAIFGTGIKGKIREPAAGAIALINSSGALKVAVDIPSGVNPDTGEVSGVAVRADATVVFHRMKKGLPSCPECTGEIKVKGIGIPPEAELVVGPGDVRRVVKPRLRDSHKGDYGRILVIGGSSQYSGAPCFSALSALRTGAGLAIIAAPSSVSNVIRGFSPTLIVRDLPGKVLSPEATPVIDELLEWASTVVVGPGLGLSDDTRKGFTEVLKRIGSRKTPTVIDADGLKLLVGNESLLRGTDAILTPHLGEFKILTGSEISATDKLEEVLEKVSKQAKKLGVTLLLKRANGIAVVSDGNRSKVNFTGNPGMAKGGVGDVLSGMAATFLSWTRLPFEAAAAAAFACGKAGDIAFSKVGDSLTPNEILENINEAMRIFYGGKKVE
ncbi:MAG: NAD(P)H-hydrate dehydratase [Promethearchaeati archaeon SRVP18_Atabeyarchaeia-1]